MPAAALVIAAENLMAALREQVSVDGDIITFADTEPIQALQVIIQERPNLVVLERLFAATPRGAALINRIKSDPQLANAEVRVMSHTGDYSRQVVKPSIVPAPPQAVPSAAQASGSNVATEDAPRPVDWYGTRRAARVRVRDGVELQLDGNPAAVIDMSTVGAQVISPTILRPNQKVRITVPSDDYVLRFRGAIAWAKFEMPKPPLNAPQYRAGVEFTDCDASALDKVIQRNRAN
jgi:CheY-like chemotaxis protein